MSQPEPIIPVFKLWNNEKRCWQWGLVKEDFERIMAGYGCGRCLEPFISWLPACPVCGEPTPNQTPGTLPPEWIRQGTE